MIVLSGRAFYIINFIGAGKWPSGWVLPFLSSRLTGGDFIGADEANGKGVKMALFDWFKGTSSNVTVLDDVIWLTQRAKLNGIKLALLKRLAEPDRPVAIMLVAHFPHCLAELRQLIEQVGSSDSMTAVSADSLKVDTASTMLFDETQVTDILVAERHPLPSHDQVVLDFAQALPCTCRLVHHLSLNDPVVRAMCGEWVEGILKKLGMAEDEAIESKMVARRIKSAQQKLGEKCFTDYPADSAREWLERNCSEPMG